MANSTWLCRCRLKFHDWQSAHLTIVCLILGRRCTCPSNCHECSFGPGNAGADGGIGTNCTKCRDAKVMSSRKYPLVERNMDDDLCSMRLSAIDFYSVKSALVLHKTHRRRIFSSVTRFYHRCYILSSVTRFSHTCKYDRIRFASNAPEKSTHSLHVAFWCVNCGATDIFKNMQAHGKHDTSL